MNLLSDLLLIAGFALVVLKFGISRDVLKRLREVGRVIDGLVNVLLVVIVVAYGLQLAYYFFKQRGH